MKQRKGGQQMGAALLAGERVRSSRGARVNGVFVGAIGKRAGQARTSFYVARSTVS